MSESSKVGKRRSTVARHGELRSPSVWGQIIRFVAVAAAVVVVGTIGVVGITTVNAVANFAGDAVDLGDDITVPPDIGEIEGGVNVFIAGTDACEAEYAGFFGDRCEEGGDANSGLNDVNLLVHISPEPRTVTVVSFPRDLMIPIPECENPETGVVTSAMSKQQLNSTFMYGGLACAVKTISELSGQEIQFAASVTWGGVIEITNAIGGVEVCIANGMKDEHTGINWPAGNRTLVGLDALQFLRTRHGVGNGGDLGRISNQQQYMSKLARKLVSDQVLSNPAMLLPLATTALQNVTPSQSLTNPMLLVQIALAVKNVPFDEIVFLQYPTFTDPDDPNRVIPNYDAAAPIWQAFAENLPIELSGDLSQGDGVIVAGEAPVEGELPEGEVPEGEVPVDGENPESPVSPPGVIVLPPSVAGQTAATDTCSNGNGLYEEQ